MIRALYSAASGMNAQQLNVDNIANNLANANTAGYKARHAQFQDLMYQNVVQPGADAGPGTRRGRVPPNPCPGLRCITGDQGSPAPEERSEEHRVGKECRSRGRRDQKEK